MTRGDELRDAGRCEAAITSWRRGLAQVAHWAFVLRIGDCYARLGRHADAVAYLAHGLELGGDELDETQRDQVRASIEQSRSRLPATLLVATPVGDAVIAVDGRTVGTSPHGAVEIEPGEHLVSLSRPDLGEAEERITVRSGERILVALDLEEAAGAEGEGRSRLSPLWGSLLLVVGAGLAGVGSYLATIDDQRLDPESYRGLDTLGPGVGLAALGGGLLVGGIVLLALRPPGSSSPEGGER